MIVQETPHLIKIEIIQTKEIEIILIIDQEITPTIDQIITITIIDPVITPGIETTTTQREENQPDPPGIDDTEITIQSDSLRNHKRRKRNRIYAFMEHASSRQRI